MYKLELKVNTPNLFGEVTLSTWLDFHNSMEIVSYENFSDSKTAVFQQEIMRKISFKPNKFIQLQTHSHNTNFKLAQLYLSIYSSKKCSS